MERLLPELQGTQDTFTPPTYDMPKVEDIFGSLGDDFVRNLFNGEQFKGFFDDMNQRQTRTGQQTSAPPPRREAPPLSKEERDLAEVQRIVKLVVASGREYGWLQREDPKVVLRVVRTVRTLRAQAEVKERTVSDRDIYIRYRRMIETPDSSPRLEASFRIIDAMMGGKVSGKLPF
jgi:hypothetical protein